jgi:hypothetical protein
MDSWSSRRARDESIASDTRALQTVARFQCQEVRVKFKRIEIFILVTALAAALIALAAMASDAPQSIASAAGALIPSERR